VLATTETTPLYAVLLIIHVLVALVAFVQVGVSVSELRRVQSATNAAQLSETTRQYFRSPAKVFSRILFLVPVSGGALVAASHGKFHPTAFWVLIGGALWFSAFGLLEAGVFSSEREVAQSLVDDHIDHVAAKRGERSAVVVATLIGLASVVMVLQPGG
jgi:hypothetical protein